MTSPKQHPPYPVITDPQAGPDLRPQWLARALGALVIDERDVVFTFRLLENLLTMLPAAVLILVRPSLAPWLALPYWIFFLLRRMGPFTLLLHNVSHRPFLKRQFGWLQSLVINWVIGPLFGHSPYTYFVHHIGMHHVEGNLPGDLSSTMPYRGNSVLGFLKYFSRFFFFGLVDMSNYLLAKKRYKLLRKMLLGEMTYLAAACFFTWLSPGGALVVFWVPFVIIRFGMMAGNWAQHAFVDSSSPDCIYRNSIAVINSSYNRNCYNDGYHLGHHLKPNRHWTEMPGDFMANWEKYAQEQAVVFQKIDYFGIWALLMIQRFDLLAKYFVDLSVTPRPEVEIEAMLRDRTSRRLRTSTDSAQTAPLPCAQST